MFQSGPPGGYSTDPDVLLDRLNTELDNGASLTLSSLRRDQRRTWLVGLQRLRARIDALACTVLVETQTLNCDGSSTSQRAVADRAASEARVDPRSLVPDHYLGLWLRRYDLVAKAFTDGWLSRAHVHQIRRLENSVTRPHLPDAQGYLVDAARTCSWADFVAVCRYWKLRFDPDGREPREQVARRSLHHRTQADGTVSGRFTLDPIAGAALVSAVEQHAQRLFRADAEAKAERTATQRRADALTELVARGAQHPDQPLAGPLIHVVMSETVAEDTMSRMATDAAWPGPAQSPGSGTASDGPAPPPSTATGPLPVHFGDLDGRCELIDGTPIHPHFVLALLATATLRRMVFGPGSEIIDLGRSARGFPLRLRQALLVRARGRCQSPGCSAPLSWLQADHLLPWHRHGPTSLANGQILCDPHNKSKRDRPPPAGGEDQAK
jgi:Domain of unknown function (DUF222)